MSSSAEDPAPVDKGPAIGWLKQMFFGLVVRPLVLLVIGINVRHRERLPREGPVILVANHNSHLDTLVLMSLFPSRTLERLRPVAARDYFMRPPILAWFARRVLGILPIDRNMTGKRKDPLASLCDSLDAGELLILFPEGSRGEPERLAEFKSGVAHLVKRRPSVPVLPIFLHGLGKSLPRGEAILVPFFCDVFVGDRLVWPGDKRAFMRQLEESIHRLADELQLPSWE